MSSANIQDCKWIYHKEWSFAANKLFLKIQFEYNNLL